MFLLALLKRFDRSAYKQLYLPSALKILISGIISGFLTFSNTVRNLSGYINFLMAGIILVVAGLLILSCIRLRGKNICISASISVLALLGLIVDCFVLVNKLLV